MDFQYEQAVEVLRRTPATLTALLQGASDVWTRGVEGDGTWSAYDVVGHMLNSDETDWLARAHTILDVGEERPFESVNRTAMYERYKDYSLDQLLASFAAVRARNIAELDQMRLTPERLALKGTHPRLGAVTLSQLLAAWVTHDLNHIGQIVEVMARQYADAVGPWIAYLSILTRPILTD